MAEKTYSQAINEALEEEMRRDEKVYILGEDVGAFGGCFGVTTGLLEKFGAERVLDAPISETAIMGSAVGAAVAGLRPVPEIMFVDFVGVCLDELLNQAAKMHYMFGGKAKVPLTLRMACGAGVGAAAQHSQSLEALMCHFPGIKVVMPATAADAKGLLKTSIRDDNPVVFLEHKALYGAMGEVPEGEYTIPLGKADIKREGKDVTILAYSMMLHKALAAAETLSQEGIEAEVIDPRTLIPFDKETLYKSLEKTGRLVIVHEAVKQGGFGGEIAALAAEECFDFLDAPIKRVAAPFTPIPFASNLEAAFIPDEAKIIAAVKSFF
ncbi:pyruvate/2-oxoglutarate dehydrogenase complex, dehydrogenase component beta subunit [Desulfosporosinus orientis DSM 765]|uniref:Pyruvate/2-oxoglutarate dehydrogenase complex, dehydrogenase component beta subunit n=1 Tax=Desulfosporosinus orientis (strain ATCC 19365 / DSM 765 / NCIMB 8382 / VKM B-1628 / Singapore I) TaxID=768706 RepID=G7WJA2_DESOD|nr:alpha-ketoacid dehydrogenase subunit beta [Desulfosporosinus orientis]AET69761.1 pyruvate/2-oxoglutarate dehydrogenase complex, dehydrogenase component beta subunit [Desulfosporosinus orientis DSM 765]